MAVTDANTDCWVTGTVLNKLNAFSCLILTIEKADTIINPILKVRSLIAPDHTDSEGQSQDSNPSQSEAGTLRSALLSLLSVTIHNILIGLERPLRIS